MKYYTSDIHFGHNKIIDFAKRPFKSIEEMDNTIINNWNNKIKPTDEVYILGDFAFYKGEKTNEILKQLNGTKYLIIGNHDCYFLKDKSFDKSLFKWIENYKEIKDNKRKVVLFHYPIAVWNASHHGSYHLHGHIHRNIETPHPLDFNLGEYALNVGMDVNNFVPMSLDELIQKHIEDFRELERKFFKW